MKNESLEKFLEDLVKGESDHSKLNKSAIKRLMEMSAPERLEYVNSVGNVPLDNEGRQLVSCPRYSNAMCALHPIYKNGSATTVCSGPMVRKTTKLFRGRKYESCKAHNECPYNPKNAMGNNSADKDDDLEDLFD